MLVFILDTPAMLWGVCVAQRCVLLSCFCVFASLWVAFVLRYIVPCSSKNAKTLIGKFTQGRNTWEGPSTDFNTSTFGLIVTRSSEIRFMLFCLQGRSDEIPLCCIRGNVGLGSHMKLNIWIGLARLFFNESFPSLFSWCTCLDQWVSQQGMTSQGCETGNALTQIKRGSTLH